MDSKANKVKHFPLGKLPELRAIIRELILRGRCRIDFEDGRGFTRIGTGKLPARRDAIAFALGLYGLRSGEVSQLKADSIEELSSLLKVHTLKQAEQRIDDVSLDRSIILAIKTWRFDALDRWAGPNDQVDALLFTRNLQPVHASQFQRSAKRLFNKLGIDRRFHSFRHTTIVDIATRTKDPILCSQVARHSSPRSIKHYLGTENSIPDDCFFKLDHVEVEPLRKAVGNEIAPIRFSGSHNNALQLRLYQGTES